MDARHNDLTGASFRPSSGMDFDPVPDPPTLSAVPSPPSQAATPVPGYGHYQVAAPVAMSAPGAAAPYPGGAPVQSASRQRVSPVVLAVIVAVVFVGVALGSFVLANSMRTPEAEVQRYLDYLAQGKASAATEMVDPGIPNSERVFLTDEVMASASSLMRVEEVVDRNPDSDAQTHIVDATVLVDGIRFTFPFEVSEVKPTLGVIKNWKIRNALMTPVAVRIKGVSTFSVGGVSAPVSDYDSFPFTSPTYMFYPGVYTVNAADLGDYIEAEPATLRATRTEYQYGADPLVNVTVESTYSDALLSAALDAVVAQANSCVTPPGNLDAVCPFALQSRTLSLLEVKKLPTELKPGQWEPNRFQGDVTFRIQRVADTMTQDIKTTAIATPEFDEDGRLSLDASGKPHFWVEFAPE